MDAHTCCCNIYDFADRCPPCQSGIHSRCLGNPCGCFTDNCPHCLAWDAHDNAHSLSYEHTHPDDALARALYANL